MLEKTIEKKVVEHAKKLGFWTRKFVSPNNRGVPDRIFAYKGRVFFIEFKAPGKQQTPLQALEARKVADAGLIVYVIDDAARANHMLDALKKYADDRENPSRPDWYL